MFSGGLIDSIVVIQRIDKANKTQYRPVSMINLQLSLIILKYLCGTCFSLLS